MERTRCYRARGPRVCPIALRNPALPTAIYFAIIAHDVNICALSFDFEGGKGQARFLLRRARESATIILSLYSYVTSRFPVSRNNFFTLFFLRENFSPLYNILLYSIISKFAKIFFGNEASIRDATRWNIKMKVKYLSFNPNNIHIYSIRGYRILEKYLSRIVSILRFVILLSKFCENIFWEWGFDSRYKTQDENSIIHQEKIKFAIAITIKLYVQNQVEKNI